MFDLYSHIRNNSERVMLENQVGLTNQYENHNESMGAVTLLTPKPDPRFPSALVAVRSVLYQLIIPLLLGGGLLLLVGTGYSTRSTSAMTLDEHQADHHPVTDGARASDRSICNDVTAIPSFECEVLVTLYTLTNGAQWRHNSNWLTINDRVSPCDWYGVVCEGQHVTQLNLARNRLRGELPNGLASLPALSHLIMNDNQLRGAIPLTICGLLDTLAIVDLHYNQLRAANQRAKECLDQINPNWLTTQTIPPHEIGPTQITTDSVQLAWLPIPYSEAGGFYEISYTTSRDMPFIVHGTTADKKSSTYLLDGLASGQPYFIRIRTHTPANLQQQEAQWSDYTAITAVTESIEDDILLLLYFPADNDLSPYVDSVIRRLRIGSRLNPNVQVIMLADRKGENNTELLAISNGVVTPSSALADYWGINEVDTMDPAVLGWFLKNGRALYPASRTVVSIMGHGVGLSPEFAWMVAPSAEEEPLPQTGIPTLPKGLHATPGDVANNGGFLSTFDLAQALAEATDNGANPFDIVFFDQCFQGNLEVLYEIRDAAHVFIASPNYAWLAAPYHQYLSVLAPSATPEQMARAIIRIYQNSLNEHHPNAIFWVEKSDISLVADAVSDLGTALLQATNAGLDMLILQATLNSNYVDTTQCGRQNLILGPPDELLGAGTFAKNLLKLFPSDHAVSVAANALVRALETIEGNAQTGRPYIAPETVWTYDDSFTILAPLPRNLPESVVWRASIYTERAPLTATWTPVPTQTISITNTFAFVRDKQWDEFIDAWYTNDLQPTVGDWCHYIPPVVVSQEITEPLALEINVADNGIQLSWDPTGQDSAVEYWVLARQADGNWRTLEVADLTKNDFSFDLPQSDQPFDFMVVAQNEQGIAVAQSNQASYSVPDLSDEEIFYLPLIH